MAGPIRISVLANASQARRELSSTGNAATSMGSKFSSAAKTVGKFAAAGLVVAGAAAVKFGIDAVKSASDLNETISKTNVIFGKAGQGLIKWAGTAADSIGQSKQQALDAASTFGTFGKAAGLSGQHLAKFAKANTQLASDLASFHNTSPEEAIEAIGSAFRGEAEPMRKYGVLLDDASLRQEALKQGLVKTTKDALSPQNKVLAAQGLILKQTGDAQGDFARTSDGLANKQRILTAKFEDVKAKIGTALLPILERLAGWVDEKVVPVLEDFGDWLNRNQGEISKAGDAVADNLLPVLKDLSDIARSVVGFLRNLPGPVQDIGIKAAAAALLLPRLTNAFSATRGSIGGFVGSLKNAETRTDALRGAARLLSGAAGLALIADASNDAEGAMKELKDTAGKTALAFSVGGPWAAAATAFVDIVGSAQRAGEDFGLSQDEMRVQIDQVTESLNRQTGAFTKRTRNQLISDLGDQGILESARAMNIELPQLVRATMQGQQGIQRFREQYLTSLPDDQRTKFIALTETLFDMSDALVSGQRGFILERDAAGKSGRAIQALRERVRLLANQYFLLPRQISTIVKSVGADKSRENVRALAKQYNLTPKEIRTIFRTGNAEAVRRDLKGVQDGAKNTRRELEDVGKARANVNQWVKDVFGGTQDGRRKAQEGARGVADALKNGTGNARADLGPFLSSLGSGVSQAQQRASSGGLGIGNALESGIVSGFAGAATTLANNAASAVTAAVNAARRAAQARSPSRKMRRVGRDMADGLILGFDDGSEGVAKVSARLANLIVTTYAHRAKAARRRIDNAKAERAALHRLEVEERRRTKSLRHLDDALVKNGKSQDAVNKKLAEARERYRQLVSESKDYATSIRDAIVETGNVTQLNSNEGDTTSTGIIDRLRDRLIAAQRFASLIRTLTTQGLNNTSLRQMLAAGVEGGLATAEAIAAGGAGAIKQINTLTSQIAAQGTSLGEDTAKTFYGAGIKAAEGVVSGLEAKAGRLDRAAKTLANRLVKAVRRALKVQSPSRVFRDIGKQTAEGLTIGLDDIHVSRAGDRLAKDLISGFGTPALDAFARTGGVTERQTVTVRLTAEQISALQRGREIQADLDAYTASGGRKRS